MKHRGELGDPIFSPELYARSDGDIEKQFHKSLEDLKFRRNRFLYESLHKISFETVTHSAFDSEFEGLRKSLFEFDRATRFHWKTSEID